MINIAPHGPVADRSGASESDLEARWARSIVLLAAAAAGSAGVIHLALTEEHFAEGPLFGGAFLAMGVYQVVLAVLLVARPGPLAYKAGIWASGLITATYVTTRVLPPPTGSTPEAITPIGVLATALELAALVLLVLALPEAPGRTWPVPAWLTGLIVGLATPPLWVFVTGAVQWTEPQPFTGPTLNVFGGPIGQLTPAVHGFLTDRLYLFLPWWAGIGAIALGLLAGANVWLATHLRRERRISCRHRRATLLGLLPAAFAAPVCCTVPLAALLGLSGATLFAAAPLATAAAIAILSGNLVWLARRRDGPAGHTC